MHVGIHGIGVYLPETIRRNDWWPASIVETWRERQARSITRSASSHDDHRSDGMQHILDGMARVKGDPFEGAVERRHMPDGMRSSDMEIAAARDALARSGVRADQIGILLTHSTTPDYLHVPNACRIHHELALPARCFSMA